MNSLKLPNFHSAELKIISSKKVLISKKSENNVRSGYMFGFNGQMKVNEMAGVGNHNTAEFWEYDTRLGRRWNLDPKSNPSLSIYSVFGDNPLMFVDAFGDTTSRFNKSNGSYIGMYDTDFSGQQGSYGEYKNIGEGQNKQQIWEGQNFQFADPLNDSKDIRDGIINKLIFVSDVEIKNILTHQGAFNYADKGNYWSFISNSTGGKKFDYSFSVIPSIYAAQGAPTNPLAKKSPLLFLPEGGYMAHNHMNFGNFLWAASGFTLGIGYAQLQIGAQLNSLNPFSPNGYKSQLDSDDDQESIKKGAFHAQQFKYRAILKVRHQVELQQQGNKNR